MRPLTDTSSITALQSVGDMFSQIYPLRRMDGLPHCPDALEPGYVSKVADSTRGLLSKFPILGDTRARLLRTVLAFESLRARAADESTCPISVVSLVPNCVVLAAPVSVECVRTTQVQEVRYEGIDYGWNKRRQKIRAAVREFSEHTDANS